MTGRWGPPDPTAGRCAPVRVWRRCQYAPSVGRL